MSYLFNYLFENLKMMWLPLPIIILLIALSTLNAVASFQYPQNCAPPNSVGGVQPAPPLPELPDTFQVRVEANIVNLKQTLVTEEYYDKIKNKASIKVFQGNSMTYMIFDYNLNQIIYDINGYCFADNLSYDDNNLLFGMTPPKTPGGMPHIYATNQAIHFAKVNGLTYMGTDTVRGIAVDHWQSCMQWPSLFANFTLDYYFTAYNSNWIEPDQSYRVPVRAIINGTDTKFSFNFYHIYEYFDFRNSIWGDDTVFETPKGVVCLHRNQTRKVPQLTGQYSYREEIVSNNVISQVDIFYDYTYKLLRYDYRPPYANYPYYTTNSVTEIHDFSTGIAYGKDNTLGNCTMFPIPNATFDGSVNISVSADQSQQFYIRMKSPSKFLYLDNTSYTYEGTRTIRGILCDVFISQRTDFSVPGFDQLNTTFEFYFLKSDWLASNNIGDTSPSLSNIPIQLVISGNNGLPTTTYNIYNFDDEDASYNRFDITSCYDDISQKPFIIQFPGAWDNSLVPYTNQFISAITDQITTYAQVSHLRIQKPQFRVESDTLSYTAILLDLPPPLAYFRQLSGRFQQRSNDLTIVASSPDDCAQACNNPDLIAQCNGFDYCSGQNRCSLSKLRSQDGSALANSKGLCDHYTRTAQMTPSEKAMDIAWQQLKNSVIIGNFIVTMQVNGQPMKFTAGSIDDNVFTGGKRTLTSQTLLGQFDMQYNKDIPGYDDAIFTKMAIDDCASACISQQSWVCNAFTYCVDARLCTLTKLHPDERPGIVINKAMCDLYSKKYTVNYNAIPGTTVLSSSDTIYQNVFSADDCAKLCSNYNSFNCKSFDFCDDISTCYLGRAHYYDIPAADKVDSPMCTHYSRKYLYDFQMSKRMSLNNVDDRIIQNVPLDQCAKLCVDQEAASCASFGYCANTTTCRLSTASMRNIGQTSAQPSLYCDVYNRMSFPDGTPYNANPSKYYGQPTNSGYSGGAMAGLAFGMIALGIMLAAAVYFGIQKFRNNSGDTMAVNFVKQETDA